MLFGSTMLEVAIGVIFVYLLVSLLCSALSELLEAFLKYRARDLEKGIGKLLDNPDLTRALLDHPLVKPLGEKPSYIPARTFSLALWNLATTEEGRRRVAAAIKAAGGGAGATGGDDAPPPEAAAPAPPPPQTVTGAARAAAAGVTQNLNEIRALVEGLDDKHFGNVKVSLLSLMDEAGNDIKKARENIEGWYDDAMDRVSGWYKRRTHKILIVMGLLAAALLNIDTVNITKALLYNDTLRTAVADAAETYVKENPAPSPSPVTAAAATTAATTPAATGTASSTPAATATTTPAADATPAAGAAATPTPESPAEAERRRREEREERSAEVREEARLAKEKIARVRGELESLGLPIGWVREPKAPRESEFMDAQTNRLDTTKFAAAQARYEKESVEYPSDPRRLPDHPFGWVLKIIGIFITGLAVSQGAPFWFDLLNKFIVIRSTVKPREKSQEQPSKDTTTKPKKPKDEDDGDGNGNGDDGDNP